MNEHKAQEPETLHGQLQQKLVDYMVGRLRLIYDGDENVLNLMAKYLVANGYDPLTLAEMEDHPIVFSCQFVAWLTDEWD